jgi:S1-C subfamily serine protease
MPNSDMWRPGPTPANNTNRPSDEQPTEHDVDRDATAPIDAGRGSEQDKDAHGGSAGDDAARAAAPSPWSGNAPTGWGQGGAGSGWSVAGPGGGPFASAPGAPGPTSGGDDGPSPASRPSIGQATTMTEPQGPWASGGSAPPWAPADTRPIPDPSGTGASWGSPPSGGGQKPPRRGNSRLVAAVLAVVLLLGAGYGLGQLRDRGSSNANASGAGIPVSVTPSQIKAGDEPVAAVAKALLPTVVQLETNQGLGSGVIYDKNGFILTAAHVVEGANQLTVRLADGTKLNGRVVGTDQGTDIGVVKVDRNNLQPAALALKVPLQVGQTAVAIGSPFGLEGSVTSGVVSAVNRSLPTDNGAVFEVLQTDAPINPGNSGGALADREGRVIGINDSIRSESGGNEGVGFAIPIDVAAASAARIVQGKTSETGYLGVSGTDPTLGQPGALVNQVQQGGPADKAGLQVGDLITSINGQKVQSMDDLAAQIRVLGSGQKVTLGIVRGGNRQTITATLTNRPNE